MKSSNKNSLDIGIKSFLTAILVIFILMIVTYVLTLIIPGGSYQRLEDENGNLVINPGVFNTVEGGIPFWKFILSPFLVLGASGNGALIAVIAFLLIIGGVFNSLDKSGLIRYMLDKLASKFGNARYKLMAVIILFFMTLGSLVGSFEECVPLVPIVVALSLSLGWDVLTGIGMSLLAVGCGFAAGVCNPFTVGVAQQIAGITMFSGVWLRIVAFALIYGLLFGFIYLHAKKVEKPLEENSLMQAFVSNPRLDKSLLAFVIILGVGICAILVSGFIPAIQDYTMIIVAVTFLIAGITASLMTGMKGKELLKTSMDGVVSILPAVLMILMASSIKYIMEEAMILDTVLRGVIGFAEYLPKWMLILFVYLIVLVMNFFIPSGSAKAFMLIPLIMPLAQVFGLSMQLCIVAFAFGDGFSNVLYPTNSALLISLGLAKTSYNKWFKWAIKFQLLNLVLTSLILLLGMAVGY